MEPFVKMWRFVCTERLYQLSLFSWMIDHFPDGFTHFQYARLSRHTYLTTDTMGINMWPFTLSRTKETMSVQKMSNIKIWNSECGLIFNYWDNSDTILALPNVFCAHLIFPYPKVICYFRWGVMTYQKSLSDFQKTLFRISERTFSVIESWCTIAC